MRPEQIQQKHYAETAKRYDDDLGATPEHELALYLLLGIVDSIRCESVLDVGAGTGRAIRFLQERRPSLKTFGVEPVGELRQAAYDSGISTERLIPGDGYYLPFKNESFDLVTEFGVLHHVKDPARVVEEMLRVARYAVFLSDTNNLGQGGIIGRLVKNACYWAGAWKLLSLLRTRGRGFVYEPNDGLWYYYSAFSHFRRLKRACHSVHVMNTRRTGVTPWFSASHVAVLATKPAIVTRSRFWTHLAD